MGICFGPFTLNLETRQLSRGGTDIHLSTKAFDLLAMLVRERPHVLSKADLQQRLWPETFVAEANLSNLIAEVRHALDDSPREPRYVRTVHRVGYAFCADVPAAPPGGRVPPAFWIEANGRHFPLPPGEHIIGRDTDAAIRLDSSTVSRRHARIVVSDSSAVLDDFGSKNGTYHQDARVTMPTPLADGDAIRIGAHLLTFRTRSGGTTETHVGLRR
jgi:hypothetical protein